MRHKYIILLMLILMPSSTLFAVVSGKITGKITDAATGEPLPGANVYLKDTAIGAATNLKGEYIIPSVPPGSYTLRVTYIGYKPKEIPVQVGSNETHEVNFKLDFDVVKGQTVTITAQAEGQVAAINQQLRSNTISNVVSAERIQELPDANAAESVGRLPGISIKRSGGEGNKIVIRGLAPTYNLITIGGEKVPATDLDDRSVDLNMISPEILAGIEVTKALTPDKDADAFGGVVNFKLADAPRGGFKYSFKFKNGYNDERAELGQYKGSLTLSNRFWEEKLGIMVTGNIERAQRGSDQFEASYNILHEKRENENWWDYLRADAVGLDYIDEIRNRKGFSLLMDYQLPEGKILLNNFMSRLDRHELIRTDRYSTDSNNHSRRFRERLRHIDVLTSSLSGEHDLAFGKVDWRLSRSSSLTRHPFDSRFRFRENGAFDASMLVNARRPEDIMAAAYNNLDNSFLYRGDFFTEKSSETDYNSQVNFSMPYTLSKKIAGYLKFGGKYIHKSKVRDRNQSMSRLDVEQGPEFEYHHSRYGDPNFDFKWDLSGNALISNYIDPNFNMSAFMDGQYRNLNVFDVAIDHNELDRFLKAYLLDTLYNFSSVANLDDYETIEEVMAGYIMTEINFGRFLMFLPGVRYERTSANMTGRQGFVPAEFTEPELDNSYISDTTATNVYENWFPMFHLRIRPTNWFDIRLAYTRSLSRPQLNWMLPKRKVHGTEYSIEFGRPDLKPQISTNFDAFLSFYSNTIGLLTFGGFYKEIDDLIFSRNGHLILDPEAEGLPQNLRGMTLDRPENNPFTTTVNGFEVEWQTNFHWLPRPFDGIVINANYSHIWSETKFPRSFVRMEDAPPPIFKKTTVIDTFRVGKMPDQADDIANVAIGYDKGPFSARLSMLYQGKTLTIVGERPEYDGFTADLVRWDLSVKYKLMKNLAVFYNLNNFTNRPDVSYQFGTRAPTLKEIYGWTTDLGIGISF